MSSGKKEDKKPTDPYDAICEGCECRVGGGFKYATLLEYLGKMVCPSCKQAWVFHGGSWKDFKLGRGGQHDSAKGRFPARQRSLETESGTHTGLSRERTLDTLPQLLE